MTARFSAAGVVRLLILTLMAFTLGGTSAVVAQDLDEKISFCDTCHGKDGRPIEPNIPIIWGQEFYYLYVQLKDFKSGLRANETMSPIAADLSKEQMQDLAKHFSKQAWPRISYQADDADVAVAERATAAGFCTQCHLGQYEGNSRIPRLAGQQPGYLEHTMLDFKNKVRLNSPAKGTLIGGYDEAQIRALAHYLAGL